MAAPKILDELEWRGLVAQSTDRDALAVELESGPITVYSGFDPTAPSLHAGHLIPLLTLRRFAPLKRLPDGSVFLSRYADVAVCYRDARMSSDKKAEFGPKFGIGTPLYRHHTTSLVFNDPPLHTRVRKLLAAAFKFQGGKDPVYWIYGFKRGAVWPFVPTGEGKERDNAEELELKAKLEQELPIEPDLSRWFAVFDAPV